MIESPDRFYHYLLLTDVLRDLDAIQRLPPSIYKLLYDVAVYSSDDAGSIRAASLFLELMAILSKEGNIELSLPMSDDYLSVWSRFGSIVAFLSCRLFV